MLSIPNCGHDNTNNCVDIAKSPFKTRLLYSRRMLSIPNLRYGIILTIVLGIKSLIWRHSRLYQDGTLPIPNLLAIILTIVLVTQRSYLETVGYSRQCCRSLIRSRIILTIVLKDKVPIWRQSVAQHVVDP